MRSRFREDLARNAQPALEEEVLALWAKEDVFRQGLLARRDAKPFVFYEGPPTANGRPGIHHVLSRTIKDVVCRHRQMTGHLVRRKAGWDTHGLPVELEVEKMLGISGKGEIEKVGIARFNRTCRENIFTYKEEWERLSERIGFWLDYGDAYVTCENDYIESVWWILKRFHEAGLVQRGHKVLPYCPRCGTPLSHHEVALGYKDVTDPAVTVRFHEVDAGGSRTGRAFLAWTTTPWTLCSNVALAVNPAMEYAEVELEGGERAVVAAARAEAAAGGKGTVVRSFPGGDLLGRRYEPVYDFFSLPRDGGAFRVHAGDFVSGGEGTGIVHMAPYGADDWALIAREGLDAPLAVGPDGRFVEEAGRFKGRAFKDADQAVVADLKARGLLFARESVAHAYPHCWRDDGPLMYFPAPAWFLRTTMLKERLVARNGEIRWVPPHVGTGRFGEWLENNVDWALSRDRYWGTPLPFWVCGQDHLTVIGSRQELREAGGEVPEDLDLHRPWVDEVAIRCGTCGGQARRVAAVADVWLDSGAMPWAQHHYPFENRDLVEKEQFPADFIAEGVDQTRGWFYTLHVLAVFLADGPASRNIVVNGMVLDREGRKMSKRLGNTVDPWKVIAASGVDPLRWYLMAGSPPHLPKRFDPQGVEDTRRRFFATLLNSHQFFAQYANIDAFDPASPPPLRRDLARADRWILSRLETVAGRVGRALEDYDFMEATRTLSIFVEEELSNWYIRRNRARFWSGEGGREPSKAAAFHTLYRCLKAVAALAAPLAPFTAEAVWRDLRLEGEESSVHLASWPGVRGDWIDTALEEAMAGLLRVVELGRQVRNEAGIKTRQPLSRMRVAYERTAGEGAPWLSDPDLVAQVREELNVKEVVVASGLSAFRELRIRPNFPVLGSKAGKAMGALKQAISALAEEEVDRLRRGEEVEVEAAGRRFRLSGEDVLVDAVPRPGFAVAAGAGYTVVLETELTPELLLEGLAVELKSRIQNHRKEEGYHPADRIEVEVQGPDPVGRAVEAFGEYLRGETLAVEVVWRPRAAPAAGPGEGRPGGGTWRDWMVNEHPVRLRTRRVVDRPAGGGCQAS